MASHTGRERDRRRRRHFRGGGSRGRFGKHCWRSTRSCSCIDTEHRSEQGRESGREEGEGGQCEERDEWGGVYWRERGYARESRRGVRGVVFGKWFTKKLGLNHFPKFYKGFSGQRKWFSVWPSFYSKTNTHKSKNILLRNKQNLNEVFPS